MESAGLRIRESNKPMQCVWMQAGVVRKKLCSMDFDCAACHFDKVMMRVSEENRRLRKKGLAPEGKRGGILFWKEKMKEQPLGQRPCLHYMKRRIQYRMCTNDYKCGNCDFDQYFLDQHTVHTVVKPIDVLDVQGFKIPQGYYLHRGHAWVKIEENAEVRIGLDDFALRMLGPLDEISAPLIGKKISREQKSILLKRKGHSAMVLSPVSGVVTALNTRLMSEGKKANSDPYTEGWVIRVHADNLRDDLKKLMIGGEAKDYLAGQIDQLYKVIEEEAGPLAADGGQLGYDIFGSLPDTSWDRLAVEFLE
ncbi:MAG: glycine cleavage system protein H [Desulfobacterales bacterium]